MAQRKKVYGLDIQDIRRAAYSMLANHGGNAAEIALKRARNLDVASESRGIWEQISATVSEMQRHGTGALG